MERAPASCLQSPLERGRTGDTRRCVNPECNFSFVTSLLASPFDLHFPAVYWLLEMKTCAVSLRDHICGVAVHGHFSCHIIAVKDRFPSSLLSFWSAGGSDRDIAH